MQRGIMLAYDAVVTRPQPRLKLIISADRINDTSPLLIYLQVVEDAESLLALASTAGQLRR